MNHLDKIKKLLRLSKSSNPHEAELALQRAMEMATKHAVDLEQLRNDPEVGGIVERWLKCGARLSEEWKLAVNVAVAFFHVAACVSPHKRQVLFVGREEAITVADYVVNFLVSTCRRCLKQFEREHNGRKTPGKRRAFKHGFFTGVRQKLREGMETMHTENSNLAIILADEATRRNDALERIVPKMRDLREQKQKPRFSAATVAGWHAGRETQINKPLGADTAPVLALR